MEVYPGDIYTSLDFEYLKKEIATYCATPNGKERILDLSPSSNRNEVYNSLYFTDEILQRLEANDGFPSTQFETINAFAQRLKTPGTQLDEKEFSLIRSSLLSYQHLFTHLEKQKAFMPMLFGLVERHEPMPHLVQAIEQRIDERGEVRSNASKELAQIRGRLVKARATAARVFDRMVKKYRDKGYTADFDETISENRRVLAIQSAYKGLIQGIFHGSSSKNSIVYIEPGETVEINNEIAQLYDDELQEIRKILRELSEEIRPFAQFLIGTESLLTEMDFIKAKATFAYKEKCVLPDLTDRSIELVNAYNPVLRIHNRDRGKNTIPLSVHLHPEQRILVISGPNAGGKSIALKTLGILSLMLQSGILIPVDPGSKMCLFEKLYADIGDHQSIANELSTYSSKLQKMKHFLANADDQTLLLIDEFGSGSDPDLGSALAQVFLEKLNSYGLYGIFTTHYSAIKALAARLKDVVNAAMLFDKKSLSPEYKLEVGNPGSSYTFEVATNSGIPKHIIGEAREKTAGEVLQVDQLLVQLQEEKLQLEKKHQRLNRELGTLKNLKRDQEKTIGKLEEKLERTSRTNEENDRLLHWGQRFQKLVDSWLDQKSQKDKKEVVSRFIGMLNQRSSETETEEKKSISKIQSKRDKRLNELKNEEVKVGDKVKILENGFTGTIAEIKRNKFLITMGNNITTWAERDQFIKADAKLEKVPKRRSRKKKFKPKDNSTGQQKQGNSKTKTPKKSKAPEGKKDSPK